MPIHKELADEGEKRAAQNLLGAAELFRALRTTMPLQYLVAFLLVAEEEGLGVGGLMRARLEHPFPSCRDICSI